ncbi:MULTISPECIES: SLOG family protein [Pseudomonas]|uniref:SLOG family protein n=1 Tax=Pseudomonas TaxID=286 RepID=UPI00072B46B0|nr:MULTISPECIES: SLOG family protein [Pseudomonas]KRW79607.1 hypothetical protein AO738_13710 [Pseudomonas citronellolis]OHS09269.1 hypothetical protein HMPREF3289_00975 [Pseudomonas sp. HMSC75E02]
MPVRIIVCGGRHYAHGVHAWAVLAHIHRLRGIAEVIQGECPTGADKHAREWAVAHGIPLKRYRAEWEKYGRAAGPRRNREMLQERPHGVVAFPGGTGTADMIAAAQEAGVPVYYAPAPGAVPYP